MLQCKDGKWYLKSWYSRLQEAVDNKTGVPSADVVMAIKAIQEASESLRTLAHMAGSQGIRTDRADELIDMFGEEGLYYEEKNTTLENTGG